MASNVTALQNRAHEHTFKVKQDKPDLDGSSMCGFVGKWKSASAPAPVFIFDTPHSPPPPHLSLAPIQSN
jgi:hypothetical protein